jgi:hemerythrin superfamily protein
MRNGKTNAISLLRADHKKVKGLLEDLAESTERGIQKRKDLLEQIARELKVHTKVEEEIFYPAFREAVAKKDDKKLYFEAVEEHHVVDLVLPELEDTDPSSETFGAKATVLKELVDHHVKEEEREMFPRAREAMDDDELNELGERMAQRKTELLASKL